MFCEPNRRCLFKMCGEYLRLSFLEFCNYPQQSHEARPLYLFFSFCHFLLVCGETLIWFVCEWGVLELYLKNNLLDFFNGPSLKTYRRVPPQWRAARFLTK